MKGALMKQDDFDPYKKGSLVQSKHFIQLDFAPSLQLPQIDRSQVSKSIVINQNQGSLSQLSNYQRLETYGQANKSTIDVRSSYQDYNQNTTLHTMEMIDEDSPVYNNPSQSSQVSKLHQYSQNSIRFDNRSRYNLSQSRISSQKHQLEDARQYYQNHKNLCSEMKLQDPCLVNSIIQEAQQQQIEKAIFPRCRMLQIRSKFTLLYCQLKNLQECDMSDFLKLVKEIFKLNYDLNYAFDAAGDIMNDLSKINQMDYLFVKRNPDFDVTDKQMRKVFIKIAKMKEFVYEMDIKNKNGGQRDKPRSHVNAQQVMDTLKIVAPKVAKHEKELTDIRASLGMSIKKVILGQAKQLTMNMDTNEKSSVNLTLENQQQDNQSSKHSFSKNDMPMSFLNLLKKNLAAKKQETESLKIMDKNLENLDKQSINLSTELNQNSSHNKIRKFSYLQDVNVFENHEKQLRQIDLQKQRSSIKMKRAESQREDQKEPDRNDKISLLKKVIAQQILKNRSTVPHDQYKVNMPKPPEKHELTKLYTADQEILVGSEKVSKYMRDKFQGPFNLNIPKLKEEMRMKRKDIIAHFTKFLAMLWYKAMKNRDEVARDPAKYLSGIDFDMFKNGAPQLMMENQHVIERIIESALNQSENKMANQLSMEDFFRCISSLSSTNFQEKIDLFFKIIDTDGNGMLSWDEVFELCQASLSDFSTGENDKFIDEMACFFADYIFKCVGYSKDDEIPMIELQNVIIQGNSTEAELLTMFCGIDNFEAKKD
ncbi:leucine rich repeat family protein [Stylonychia lemnae]|uniref:Leucine rich repeat family protein n=1 Tax=Stylonychia lemnae TaxID=5949 RepID=A0A078B824_STYLE|nr:leucine rich repeat family protein [Stylonychia lemnae]|eukprot:CDW90544.1 leucine rich repeat family protein [Stylonychia lemnae]